MLNLNLISKLISNQRKLSTEKFKNFAWVDQQTYLLDFDNGVILCRLWEISLIEAFADIQLKHSCGHDNIVVVLA